MTAPTSTALIERLRNVLELVLASAAPNPAEHPTMFNAWNIARSELDALAPSAPEAERPAAQGNTVEQFRAGLIASGIPSSDIDALADAVLESASPRSAAQEAPGPNDWDIKRMLRLRAQHERNVAAGNEESDLDFLFRMLSFRVAGDATPQHSNGPTQASSSSSSSAPPVDVASLRALSAQWEANAVQSSKWATEADAEQDGANSHAWRKETRIWRTCKDDLDRLIGEQTQTPLTGKDLRFCSVHGTGECWCLP